MSRLDSFIRRLEAQRACLGRAADLIADLPGAVLELGLGNGRTYDHLREILPARDIYVCERRVAAHPDCTPPADRLLLGDMFDTLPAAAFLVGRVALAHFDAGNGDAAADRDLAAGLRPLILPLLREGGVLATQQGMEGAGLEPLALPEGVRPDRYYLYRRTEATDPPLAGGFAMTDGCYSSKSTTTGTWSEAFSQFRASRCTCAAFSAPTSGGVTQMWSSRRPRSEAAQSRLR